MFAVLKLVGSRSLPWLVHALLDYLSQKVSSLEMGVEELRGLMPKAITIPPHDEGVEGNLKHFVEQLQWATNFDIRKQMLQGLKEIGSIIFWMSLLDTAMVNVLCKMSLIASAYWNLIYNKQFYYSH
jgi:cytoplasmic FMR1 interacting protein